LGVANFVEEGAVEVKLSLPRKAFKWFMVVARSIKKYYDVERPLDIVKLLNAPKVDFE
jgi:hypothetical protein